MSDSYILHDVMRKVKADGLFDSIRRDLICDIEQKPSYLDLKSSIESSMSTYLGEHKWSSSLKKSELRERARRHIETCNLIKDNLPSMVNQYMQTCQEQLVQPRLSSFVSDHIEHVYHSIGGTHVYRPSSSYTQSAPIQQESLKFDKISPSIKTESIVDKLKTPDCQSSNPIKKKISNKELSSSSTRPSVMTKKPSIIPIKQEKKTRVLSPVHSPAELIDISPSPPSINNEQTRISSSPSPPPPIVRIAAPLVPPTTTEITSKIEPTRKIKRSQEINDATAVSVKRKKTKIDDEPSEISQNTSENKMFTSVEEVTPAASTVNETDTRKLRPRRPNPKYSKEQFETGDLIILDSLSPPTIPKTKKLRPFKSFTSVEQEKDDYPLDTPSSPPPNSAPIERSHSISDMSPEYGTSLPSPTIEPPPNEVNDERSRTPSPVTTDSKQSASPRRLRPRKANERSTFVVDNHDEKPTDLSARTALKSNEMTQHRPEQIVISSMSDGNDPLQSMAKKSCSSSITADHQSNEEPTRSLSVPDNLNTTADESQTTRSSSTSIPNPVSKSFIWKPKISK